eukprot:TRINITY_DN8616_c0_g1_i4.p1 TRINITY_DN8616_c0_g1~~TRINITY_DN8616_c0_g1_i4.p1  ORF type:complete len:255 (-),score=39.02 TRINITY_DN8616_c0_g1_i4:277-942(-)
MTMISCMHTRAQITVPQQKYYSTTININKSRAQNSLKFGRRQILQTSTLLGLILGEQFSAEASVLQDLGRKYIREAEILPEDAVQQLIKAQNTLKNLKMIAEIPQQSDLRRKYEAYYPGMAKQLRQLESVAPVVVNASNKQGEDNLSVKYGGNVSDGKGVVDSLFEALGEVLTISGRTIKDEARTNPAVVQNALDELEIIIKMVPATLLAQASNASKQNQM